MDKPLADVAPSGALTAAFEWELRRLRFGERDLERAFVNDYARRRIPQFRVVLWVEIFIQLPVSLRFLFVEHWSLAESRFWFRLAVGVVAGAAGLLLIRSPRFVRWGPAYMVVHFLFLGVVLVGVYGPIPNGWTFLSIFLVAACIMSRLRAREAVIVEVALIGWFATYSILVLDKPFASLSRGLPNLAILTVFITAANYMIENSARRDFILLRLLGQEREKSERLLLNVLPAAIAERLKESPGTIADSFDEITVLFADIADSTPQIARLEPETAVELLNDIFTAFDRLAIKHGLEKIKTIGDAYMVVGGLPEPRVDHARAVVAMAVDMQREIAKFRWPTGEPLVLRIGINTGPAVAGVIGTSKFIYDLWGDTVNVASRMESHGVAGGIQLTQTTYSRVRRHHRCAERMVNVKGKGQMPVYLLDTNRAKPRKARTPRVKATR